MIEKDLEQLGEKIAKLRIAKKLKQSELAYEAGVSKRTLQRIEAGEVVKTDGLLKVIRQLGRIEEFLSAIATASFSPYQLATQVKARNRRKHSKSTDYQTGFLNTYSSEKTPRERVRRSKSGKSGSVIIRTAPQKLVWPEDQE
jgi:transcriptional regulator with XRE-family HTH domain